jgi:hypothetical protein
MRAAGAGTACCRIDQHKYGNCKASLGREVSVRSTGWKIRYRHRRWCGIVIVAKASVLYVLDVDT